MARATVASFTLAAKITVIFPREAPEPPESTAQRYSRLTGIISAQSFLFSFRKRNPHSIRTPPV